MFDLDRQIDRMSQTARFPWHSLCMLSGLCICYRDSDMADRYCWHRYIFHRGMSAHTCCCLRCSWLTYLGQEDTTNMSSCSMCIAYMDSYSRSRPRFLTSFMLFWLHCTGNWLKMCYWHWNSMVMLCFSGRQPGNWQSNQVPLRYKLRQNSVHMSLLTLCSSYRLWIHLELWWWWLYCWLTTMMRVKMVPWWSDWRCLESAMQYFHHYWQRWMLWLQQHTMPWCLFLFPFCCLCSSSSRLWMQGIPQCHNLG